MTLNLQESFGHVMGALPRVRRSRIKFIVYGFELKLDIVQLLGSAITRLGLDGGAQGYPGAHPDLCRVPGMPSSGSTTR